MSHNKPSKRSTRKRTDKEKLELFVEKANELMQTRLSKKGHKLSLNISIKVDKPIQNTLTQPDESDFKEHLLVFRPFTTEKEDVFLNSILNIFYNRCIDDEGKNSVIELRKIYQQTTKDNFMEVFVQEKKYSSLEITDIYLNGKYFHSDLDFQEFLNNLDPSTATIFRAKFINFVLSASKIVIVVSQNIELGFKLNAFNFA